MAIPWGISFHCDLDDCLLSMITDPNKLKFWMKGLVADIQMTAFGECQSIYFGEAPDKCGWTIHQYLTTSNITCHFCDSGKAFIDIFTCKSDIPNLKERIEQNLFHNLKPSKIKIDVLKIY